MPLVRKGNKELTVNEEKVEEFLKLGYSQVDEEGEIIKVGQATDLKSLKDENDTLKAELLQYRSIDLKKIEAIKAENKALKAEIKELKVANKAE